MSRYFHSPYQKKEQRPILHRYFFLSSLFLGVCLVGTFIILGTLYLLQTNSIAIQGYALQALKNDLLKLQEEKQQLEIQVAQLQSLPYLKQQLEGLDMVPIEKTEYLSNNDSIASATP